MIESPWVELETSTLPLSETKGDESKSLSVASVNISRKGFSKDISRIVSTRDVNEFD